MEKDARLEQLRQKALSLPQSPGVYLMKDAGGAIIYVGKAKILPRRVSSYFQKEAPSARVGLMVSKVADFDFMVTATEKESLILENSLIKQHRPRFNVVLRDDKTYPSLRLSVNEDYPRLEVVRRPARDGSIIFGPFPSVGALRDTVRLAMRLFPLRQCRRPDVKNVDRPCLNYEMGRCVAPCRPEMTPEEYRRVTDQARLFFNGKHRELLDTIESEMRAAAETYDYERAAKLRDRLNNIKTTLERQVVDQADYRDIDVLGFYQKDGLWQASLLMLRSGRVNGCLPLEPAAGGESIGGAAVIISLLGQFYTDHFVPDAILLPEEISEDDREMLEEWLSSLKGRAVRLYSPQRGDKTKLLTMAAENAKAALEDRLNRIGSTRGVMVELKAKLGLDKIPHRLECVDLAHLQGRNAAAGLVVMEDGEWKKAHYRRFKIKSAKGGDDYGGMREVVARRFAHEEWPWPDLLLIDGGKGQLASALAAFDDLGLSPRPQVAAIAEARQAAEIDRIFLPGRKNPVDLKAGSAGLLLLSRLRDEAHRYVGDDHRRLEADSFLDSPLLKVPGLGQVKRQKLLDNFGSLEKLAAAKDEDILAVVHLSEEGLGQLREVLENWDK
jgi:excinuclease ABC subunit C